MALKDTWVDKIDDVDDVSAEDINAIAKQAIDNADAIVGIQTPYIGENGNWFIYDAATKIYVDSGKPSQGEQGEQGPQGEAGYTPVKGEDYFTEDDKQEIVDNVLATEEITDLDKRTKQLQYYGDANIEPSEESLFTFALNEDGESYSVAAAWEVTDTSVTSIVIPYEYKGLPVTALGQDSFRNRDALKSVTIPNSVTSIGASAFYDCYSLNRIPIPNSVTSIGASAFGATDLLQKIEIPNTVTNIGIYAFTGAEFEKIVIPHNVLTIAEGTFFACGNLKKVTIPQSVMNIGRMAFYNCASLTDIYYEGSPFQWEQITIEANNEPLLNVNIHFGYVDAGYYATAEEVGDIDTALDSILAMQNELIGGDSV